MRERLVPLLQQLIGFDTVSPPSHTEAIAVFIRDFLAESGIETELLPASAPGLVNCFARIGKPAPAPAIGMLSHLDVVSPMDESCWYKPPFGGELEGGFLWGRGAMDMKAFLAVQLLAMAAMAQEAHKLPCGLVLLCTADEERGGVTATRELIAQKSSEIKTLKWIISEGGCIYRKDEKLLGAVSYCEKKSYPLSVIFKSRSSGHAAVKNSCKDNIIFRIPEILQRVREFNDRQIPMELPHIPADQLPILCSSRFFRNGLVNTLTPTKINAGIKGNMIPGSLELRFDCRLVPGQDEEEFMEQVRASLSVEGLQLSIDNSHRACAKSTESVALDQEDAAFIHMLQKAIELPASFVCAPFMTDLHHFRQAGIRGYGFSPFRLGDGELELFHGFNEKISLEELEAGFGLFMRIINEACTSISL